MASVPPKGIYTPLPTFFKNDEDYSLDLETQLQHFDHIQLAGVAGVLVGGSNGEAVHLTKNERHQVVKAVRERCSRDDFVILAGAIGVSIADIVEDISQLKEMGANYAVLLVPGYYGTTLTKQQGIIDWFSKIANKSALPVLIYNYPGVQNGIDLTYDSYVTLSKHPNIVGCKLTHYNFPLYTLLCQSAELKKNNFRNLAGVGQVLLPGLSVGVEGCIDGLSNVFPKAMVRIFTAYETGNCKEAQQLQAMVTMVNEMTAVLNILGLKYAIKYVWDLGDVVHGRPPLNQDIDVKVWEKYLPAFDQLLEVEKKL